MMVLFTCSCEGEVFLFEFFFLGVQNLKHNLHLGSIEITGMYVIFCFFISVFVCCCFCGLYLLIID